MANQVNTESHFLLYTGWTNEQVWIHLQEELF